MSPTITEAARREVEEAEVALDVEKKVELDGATRSVSTGKGRFDLLPPWALQRLAKHFQESTEGKDGYPERNWEKGIRLGRYLSSAIRHLEQWWGGMNDEPHLVSALWNIMCMLETDHRIDIGMLDEKFNDRPPTSFEKHWTGIEELSS